MALKLIRLMSFRNICFRPFRNNNGLLPCVAYNNHLSPINFLYSRRFQHSEVGKETFGHLPADKAQAEDKQRLGSEIENPDPDRIQCIRFERLKQNQFATGYRQRIKEIIENEKDEADFDLDNVILKAVEDVCGTSQKVIYKCNKCKNVFRDKGHLVQHQKSRCTGFKSEVPFKKKCDKCFKLIYKINFEIHYSTCKGVQTNQNEVETARVNCPDCGMKIKASYMSRHKKSCKGRPRLAEDNVKCPDCGEVLRNKGNLKNHLKSCTGLRAVDPTKKICDKCLKEFEKIGGSFAKHYKTCKGVVDSSTRVNCPDCDKELRKVSLYRHLKFFCHGKQKQMTKDEVNEESDLLTNIIMKAVEENYFVNDKMENNSKLEISEDRIEELRSSLTRIINVTLLKPEYNAASRGVCPDCGLVMAKGRINKHRELHCPKLHGSADNVLVT